MSEENLDTVDLPIMLTTLICWLVIMGFFALCIVGVIVASAKEAEERDRAIKAGTGEYYLDVHYERQFRNKEKTR